MLKWGVVGLRADCQFLHHSRTDSFRQLSSRCLYGCRPTRAQSTAERFKVDKWTTDLSAFLENKEIEAVYIAVPNAYHAQIACAVAAAGKHILCEKPLGMNVAECEQMIAAAQKHNVRLMVAQMSQFNNFNRKAREFIQAGVIGDAVLARAYFASATRTMAIGALTISWAAVRAHGHRRSSASTPCAT
jgi:predicted dehydrogenase